MGTLARFASGDLLTVWIGMPRYFFRVYDGVTPFDEQGIELAGDAAAYREAVELAAMLLEDRGSRLWGTEAWAVAVQAADGRQLARITIGVVVSLSLERRQQQG